MWMVCESNIIHNKTYVNLHWDFWVFSEPARFETASRNVSSRRNDPIALSCLAKGDDHINIIWLHNNNRIDLNNYR